MTTHAETVELMPDISSHRPALRRAALGMVLPLIVYGVATQFVRSSALALGIAGGVSVVYSIVLAVAQRRIDPVALLSAMERALGALVGGFLVLHALVHLALAVYLTTSSYVIVSRLVNWGTLAVGALALSAYLRHLRARSLAVAGAGG